MQKVKWACLPDMTFCPLRRLDLSSVNATGVYMIWYIGAQRVVRVGQGDIAKRLSEHRQDPEIMQYEVNGTLLATWAAISPGQMDAVERHLADRWRPLVGDRWPNCLPLAINAPWE